MTNSAQNQVFGEDSPDSKRTYVPPVLECHGTLRELIKGSGTRFNDDGTITGAPSADCVGPDPEPFQGYCG